MIMNILEEIHLAKNHSQSTRHVYQVAAEKYCTYFEMTLQELLQEAETEEGRLWRDRPDGHLRPSDCGVLSENP